MPLHMPAALAAATSNSRAMLAAVFGAILGLAAAPLAAAEVGLAFFGTDAVTESFETAGGTGFYFGGPITIGDRVYAGSPSTQAGGFVACRSGRCLGNNLDQQVLRVSLGSFVSAAGGHVSGFSDSWSVRADFRDAGDGLLGSVTRSGSGAAPAFIGFQSLAAPIARVDFTDLAADVRIIVLDDFVTLAATAAVPEPATWALLVAGFGALGGAARRRRRRLATTTS